MLKGEKRIVPSATLCRQIPRGSFEDSIFVWNDSDTGESVTLRRVAEVSVDEPLYPAPTLEEILKGNPVFWIRPYSGKQIGDCEKSTTGMAVLYGHTKSNSGHKSYKLELCEYRDIQDADSESSHKTGASAALKAWLRDNLSGEGGGSHE